MSKTWAVKYKQKTKKTGANSKTNTRQVSQEYITSNNHAKQDIYWCVCTMQEFCNSCYMCAKAHVHNDQKWTTKKQKQKKRHRTSARNISNKFSHLIYQPSPRQKNAKPPKQAQQGVWRSHTQAQVFTKRWQQIFLSSLESQSDYRNYPEWPIRKF